MKILLIDPGATTHGIVVLETDNGINPRLISADPAASTDDVISAMGDVGRVIIERVRLYQMVGNSVGYTMENSSMFNTCAMFAGQAPLWVYRADVKNRLGITGGHTNPKVREAIKSEYGEDCFAVAKLCKKRKNKSHGDDCELCDGGGEIESAGIFCGVKSHSVQALALFVAFGGEL